MLTPARLVGGVSYLKFQLSFLNKLEEYFLGISILIITGILFMNVVLRYLFNSSIEWAEEFTRYGVMWITFIGASVCIYKGAHLGIDTLISALEKRGIRFLTFLVYIVATIFSFLFFYLSLLMTIKIYETGQLSAVLRIPMFYVYAALPLSGLLMTLRFIQQIILEFQGPKE